MCFEKEDMRISSFLCLKPAIFMLFGIKTLSLCQNKSYLFNEDEVLKKTVCFSVCLLYVNYVIFADKIYGHDRHARLGSDVV